MRGDGLLHPTRVEFYGGKMVRGCQRKVVFLKNTDSRIFREAYFIIDDRIDTSALSDGDMVREANRIIDESLEDRDRLMDSRTRGGRVLGFLKRHLPAFLVGVGCTLLFTFIF